MFLVAVDLLNLSFLLFFMQADKKRPYAVSRKALNLLVSYARFEPVTSSVSRQLKVILHL